LEVFETLLKLIGIIFFYGLLFIFGSTMFVFLMLCLGIHYIASAFGIKKSSREGEGK